MLRELLEQARAERMDDLSHFIEMAYLLSADIVRGGMNERNGA